LLVFIDINFNQLYLAPGGGDGLLDGRAKLLQGPHKGAQKSTITGTCLEASITSAAKLEVSPFLIRSCRAP